MEQTEGSDNDTKTLQRKGNQDLAHYDAPRRWPIIVTAGGLLAAASGGVALILWAAGAIDDLGVALTFIAQNILGLFVFLAIIAQSFIYWDQRNLMRKQWLAMERQERITRDALIISNRASVGIHSIEYDRAKRLITVKIENIGLVPAEKIDLFLEVIVYIPFKYVDIPKTPTSTRRLLKYRVAIKPFGSTQLRRGNLPITCAFPLWNRLREKESDLINEGRANLAVHGHISYEAGFIGEPRQHTNFWFFYVARGDYWVNEDPEIWREILGGTADNEREDSEVKLREEEEAEIENPN
jgi:hypothetical protein